MTEKLPVLLIAFNRFEYTEKVISVLFKYQPSKLYLAMDAPKDEDDRAIQNRIIELVSKSFSDSKLLLIRAESNQGTGLFIPDAITKFFEFEEFGIILEDDCVPTLTFFEYCQQLNSRHENIPQIMAICGSNLFTDGEQGDAYCLGPFFVPWGWATWRDKWESFDRKEGNLDLIEKEINRRWYTSDKLRNLMAQYIENATKPETRVWTGFWLCSMIRADGVIATPDTNLVTNIGFQGHGVNASTKLQRIFTRESFEIHKPIFHESNKSDLLALENKYFDVLNSASSERSKNFLGIAKKLLQRLKGTMLSGRSEARFF